MSDGVQFQSATPATPPATTVVATDNLSGTHHQLVKIEFGDNGTAYAVSYGTPLPIGTLPGGTFSVNGTLQVLGSVSIVGTLAGGTVGILGTVQGLGTYQPLAGSVHVANTISGTVQTHGTSQMLGTVQPLAGSVHLASRLPGTVDVGTIAGTVQTLGTAVVRGDVAHDAVDSGSPIKLGGKVSTSTPTPVANADRTDAYFDEYGRLVVSDRDVEIGLTIGVTGLRDRLIAQRYTVLADSLADGLAGFWTSTTAGGGSATSSGGEGLIQTSTGPTGSAQLSSTAVVYFPGQVGWFNSAVRFNNTGTANNTRRIGVYTVSGTTPQDGFYYELSGTTLNAVIVKAGSATATASTSWSRVADAPFTLDTNYHSFEIRYTANTVWFYIDNVLRHRVSGTTASITATLNFPITIHSINTSGATNNLIAVRNCGIGRFGDPAQPVSETGLSAVNAIATGGATPHDSVDSGNPLKIGGRAQSTAPTAVADGDRVNAWFDQNGAQVVTFSPNGTAAIGTIAGTVQVLGTVQTVGTRTVVGTIQVHGTVPVGTIAGTVSVLGTVQPLAGSVHVAAPISGTVQVHGTVPVGTVAGTVSALGTVQPLAGSVHLATNLAGGTVVSVGSAVHGAVADTRPHLIGVFGSSGTPAAVDDGDAVRLWADLNGRLQIRGTIDSMPAIAIGTISGGTIQAHGTTEILGTVRALTTVNVTVGTIAEGTINSFTGTAQVLGTIQTHGTVPIGTVAGTVSVLGTIQPLAGSVHLATGFPGGTVVTVGSAVHGAVADARPHLMAAFGSSGTQAAVDDGDSVRLWADLNGRLQVRGTIDSIPSITIGAALPAGDNNIGNVDVVTMPTVTVTGTVQTHGTVSVGTVAGTVSVLGTVQPLAGSVHLASILPGGSVSAQGYVAHDAAVAGNPMLVGGFGSSGTQAAVADGDVVRAWFDLNGRQVVRGTIDSIPNITITAGTVSLNTGGTIHVGTVQRVAGTVDIGTIAGTVAVRTAFPTFGSYFGSAFTAAVSNGTLIAPLGQGTRWRLHDVTVSASAAGTVQLTEASSGSVVWGPLFFAANGGFQSNSALGYRARGTNLGLFVTTSAGTTSVTVNYQLETP